MELGNNQKPDEVIPSELEESQPIKFRLHHLVSIAFNAYVQNKMVPYGKKPFDQLYLFPELVDEFIKNNRDVREKDIDRHLRGRLSISDEQEFSSGSEARNYAEDLVGKKGTSKQEYLDSIDGAFRLILGSSPDTKIQLVRDTDIICNACQSNGPNKPGDHCLVMGGANKDAQTYRWVEKIRTTLGVQKDIVEKYDELGRHTFEMSLGFFRSQSFLSAIYNEFHEEANSSVLPQVASTD